MFPQNNPLGALLGMARSGGNPRAMVQQMARTDPRMAQFMQMVDGKSPQQLQQLAASIATERGIDLNAFVNSLGMR